jgi:hypothetical protein
MESLSDIWIANMPDDSKTISDLQAQNADKIACLSAPLVPVRACRMRRHQTLAWHTVRKSNRRCNTIASRIALGIVKAIPSSFMKRDKNEL